MKRVAILFHGHLRSYCTTARTFRENVVQHLKEDSCEVDVFLHTWDEEEFTTQTWHSGTKNIKHTDINKIVKEYDPKRVKIEKQILENTERIMFTRPYSAVKSVWYSFNEALDLMVKYENEKNIKYDYVIVSRPDVIHYEKLNLKELYQGDYLWQCQVYCNGAASDVLFYSSRDNIEKSIGSFYSNFDELHSLKNLKNTTWQEFTFNEYIKKIVDVKVSKYCMPRDWRIQRSWWSVDHKEGHRKWDRDLAEVEIETKKEYEYFKKKNNIA